MTAYLKNKVVELILKWVSQRKALPDYSTNNNNMVVTVKPAYVCEILQDVRHYIGTKTIIDILPTRVTIIPYSGKEWRLTLVFPAENVVMNNYTDSELFPPYHYDIDDFMHDDDFVWNEDYI